jgi:cobalt-precorrin 5A hydrolase
MAGAEAMIAAGIGCRRGTSVEELEAALNQAQMTFGVRDADIAVLATLASKVDEPSIQAVARLRGLRLQALSKERLGAVADKVASSSERVRQLVGVDSVAEAAALAAAGRNARLLGPRIATATTTCALAEGDGPLEPGEEGA